MLQLHKKYYARSASDKTDDWPLWFVANQQGINVTVQLFPELSGRLPFVPKHVAVLLADVANEGLR
jgi:hypothetical protein